MRYIKADVNIIKWLLWLVWCWHTGGYNSLIHHCMCVVTCILTDWLTEVPIPRPVQKVPCTKWLPAQRKDWIRIKFMGQSSSWGAASSSAKHKSAIGPYNVRPSAGTFVGNVMNNGGKKCAYILIGFKTVSEIIVSLWKLISQLMLMKCTWQSFLKQLILVTSLLMSVALMV